MKVIFLIFSLSVSNFLFAQTTATIFGSFGDYKLEDKKIYEIKTGQSPKLIASISGDKIYKDTSTLEKDILYIIGDNKVYKSVQIQDSLLYYISGTKIYKRVEKGKIEYMGDALYRKKNETRHIVMERVSPLEYFAILFAEKDIPAD